MRAPPSVIAWLQRALQHEFAAARQFALQASMARRLGDSALARFCSESAQEELEHAQRLAAALIDLGAGFGGGAAPAYPVGGSRQQILAAAAATERQAVTIYERALRACAADSELRALFCGLHAEECEHLDKLRRWAGDGSAAGAPHGRRIEP